MDAIRFIFWEGVKILGLVLLSLLAAKFVATLKVQRLGIRPAFYAVILGLAALGSWFAGNDVATEVYLWTCYSNWGRGRLVLAYSNAMRAVAFRPGDLRCWSALEETKMRLRQPQSVLDDEAAVRALAGGRLDMEDEYQFALAYFYLGKYDKVIAATSHLIRQYPPYAAPYVLQGLSYTAEKKYPEGEQSFLAILQIFPTYQAAVEGLAQAYFLAGERRRALAVLADTAKFPFAPPARQRFEALKGLYDQ